MLCGLEVNLWRQVAAVAGMELIEGLCTDVAAPEWLGGDVVAQRGEGVLHRGADGWGLVTTLDTDGENK